MSNKLAVCSGGMMIIIFCMEKVSIVLYKRTAHLFAIINHTDLCIWIVLGLFDKWKMKKPTIKLRISTKNFYNKKNGKILDFVLGSKYTFGSCILVCYYLWLSKEPFCELMARGKRKSKFIPFSRSAASDAVCIEW